jgi:hypothetical protein
MAGRHPAPLKIEEGSLMQSGASVSPERGGASVMGGECSALPATYRRQIPKEASTMLRWFFEHREKLEDIACGICCCITGVLLVISAGCLS